MPISDTTNPIDRYTSPLMWGEVVDLGNAILWTAQNVESNQPFAINNNAPGVLLFGFGVVSGSGTTMGSGSGVRYPAAVTDTFEGIVFATDSLPVRLNYTQDAAGRFGYPPPPTGNPGQSTFLGALPNIIRKADRIAVPIETAVNKGDPVFMRAVIGTGVARGTFRNAAVAGETIQIPRARFLQSQSAPAAGTLGTGFILLEGIT